MGFVSALLLLVTFVSGFYLRRRGRPRPTPLLALHKLIALGAIVAIGLTARWLSGAAGLEAAEIGALALTAGLFICAIASGGWLSTARPTHRAVSVVHLLAPPLSVLASLVMIYLLIV